MIDLLMRRRETAIQSLPYDAEIEWIQGDGNSWFNLGFVSNYLHFDTTNFELKFECTENKTFVWAGCNVQRCQFVLVGGRFRFDFAMNNDGGAYVSEILTMNTPYTLIQKDGQTTVGNTTYTNVSRSLTGTQKFYLFTRNPREASTTFTGKIYYFRITDRSTGNDKAFFIPVRIGQVGYLYDKMSGQLFGNQGTGAFLLGPDVISGGVLTPCKSISYALQAERRAA